MYWIFDNPIQSIIIVMGIPLLGSIVGTTMGLIVWRFQVKNFQQIEPNTKNKQVEIRYSSMGRRIGMIIALIGIVLGCLGSSVWFLCTFLLYSVL